MKRYIGAALLAGGLCTCRGSGDKPRSSRGSGVAPIEVVNQPKFPDAGGRASGVTADEIEPNDGDDVATPFALNGTMRGTLDPETDVDHYRLEIDKPGALSLMLSAVDADLVVELEDSNGAMVARSARGGARVKEGLPNFGVVAGRYTVVVKAAARRKAKPAKRAAPPAAAPVYALTAQFVAIAPSGEHEPDEDRGTANDLLVGESGTGFVGWAGDTDVWKLSVETLSAKNSIDLEVSAVEGVALELDVDDGIANPVIVRKAPRGAPLIVRGLVPIVPPSSPPFHYLTIKGNGSNPETGYTLKVTQQVPVTDAELEPNDSVDKPFVMPNDRTVVHARWTPGDVDCFGLAPAAAARTIAATIHPPSDFDVAGELFVDGKVVEVANKAKQGGEEKLTGSVPPNAKAVVCAKSADPNATGEAAYDLEVQEAGNGDNAP
ncbi:hypothetical protein BH11MYX1_BH11MYX1_37980 [soil metagenome]